MRKVLVLAIFFMLIFLGNVDAAVVRVQGSGLDKGVALKDAMRLAVERVIGTYVDSKTLVEQAAVVDDKILTKAQGFVTDVQIIKQSKKNGNYWIDANVDVNTNPNSELRNQLALVSALGNPRIGVIVLRKDRGKETAGTSGINGDVERTEEGTSFEVNRTLGIDYDEIVEVAVNNKLEELGFTHIVEPKIVAKLRNSSFLNDLCNGRTNLGNLDNNYGLDVLVLANSTIDTTKVKLMKVSNKKNNEGEGENSGNSGVTPFIRGTVVVTGKVVIVSNGEIKGTFMAKGIGVDISGNSAQMRASEEAAVAVSKEVGKILRRKSARLVDSKQIKATVNEQETLERLIRDLQKIKGIEQVYIREYREGKALLDLDTSLQLHVIFRQLRGESKLGLFNEGIDDNVLNIIVS